MPGGRRQCVGEEWHVDGQITSIHGDRLTVCYQEPFFGDRSWPARASYRTNLGALKPPIAGLHQEILGHSLASTYTENPFAAHLAKAHRA